MPKTSGKGRRPPLPDEVAARVRDDILTGRARPGEHLPLERLAERWDVSVTPVREALLTLRGVGLVDLEPRRGFTVAQLTRQDISDVYLMLAGVASELAARAARRMTAQALVELDETQDALERAEPELVDEIDRCFHRAINAVAESGKLRWSYETLGNYTPRHSAVAVSGWLDTTVLDHRLVQRALHDGDAHAARYRMHAHVTNLGRLLVQHLESRRFWAD